MSKTVPVIVYCLLLMLLKMLLSETFGKQLLEIMLRVLPSFQLKHFVAYAYFSAQRQARDGRRAPLLPFGLSTFPVEQWGTTAVLSVIPSVFIFAKRTSFLLIFLVKRG